MHIYFNQPTKLEHTGIAKYKNGMMLYDVRTHSRDLLITYSDLFALPYSVYLLDKQGATLKINEEGAFVCGFKSPDLAVGKTIFDVSLAEKAQYLLDNCDAVLQQESVKIFDEFTLRWDGRSLHFLSIKFPCYTMAQQLQGTLGISIVLGKHPLAQAITQLTQLGLLPRTTPHEQQVHLNLGTVVLTPREQQCLEYTVKGFTAKEIAKELVISPRTVEEYLNQLKIKLKVQTKQQLIQKVLAV